MTCALVQPPAAPPLPEQLLFSPSEASAILGISRAKLYQLLAGGIASVKIGRSRRIHRSELERVAREGVN